MTYKENIREILKCYFSGYKEEIIDSACNRILEQQQKTGHWIPSHIPESILDECSECGFSCGAFTFNYCPMCGAKMESEASE